MTQEERQLLLKDLCARLPYGVKLNFYSAAIKENYTCTLLGIEPNDDKSIIAKTDSGAFMFPAEHIKPYLRPMSSMTEEKKKAFDKFVCIDEFAWNGDAEKGYPNQAIIMSDGIDWLLSHHFDFRGLIEKSLAIDCTNLNIYKEK